MAVAVNVESVPGAVGCLFPHPVENARRESKAVNITRFFFITTPYVFILTPEEPHVKAQIGPAGKEGSCQTSRLRSSNFSVQGELIVDKYIIDKNSLM